jgi:hypothetical protein
VDGQLRRTLRENARALRAFFTALQGFFTNDPPRAR